MCNLKVNSCQELSRGSKWANPSAYCGSWLMIDIVKCFETKDLKREVISGIVKVGSWLLLHSNGTGFLKIRRPLDEAEVSSNVAS